MCRKSKLCSELSANPEEWNKLCPIPYPSFFYEAIEKFSEAVKELSLGRKKESLKALRQSKSHAVGHFYIEHGKQSAYFRVANWQKIKNDNQDFIINKVKDVIEHPMISKYFERNQHVLSEQDVLVPNGVTLRPDRVNLLNLLSVYEFLTIY